jgi:hypothetical protein
MIQTNAVSKKLNTLTIRCIILIFILKNYFDEIKLAAVKGVRNN